MQLDARKHLHVCVNVSEHTLKKKRKKKALTTSPLAPHEKSLGMCLCVLFLAVCV